jgi:transposase
LKNPLNQEGVLKLPGGTEIYSRSRNSVKQIPFELAKSLSKMRPLWSGERFRYVRLLTDRKPNTTLKELCEQMRVEQGLSVSISSMSRALKRL